MNNVILDLLVDQYFESETLSPEEKDFYNEALKYVNPEYLDEAESAITLYAGKCVIKAFKQGFVTAFHFFLELQ